jgi:hypothetical protein
MSARRIIAIAATGALALGGAGAAIAAVSKDDPGKSEDAVLADAAKRLDVTPDKLRAALKAAQSAELDKKLDAAVKAGDLTRKQADEIKKAREQSGSVLGGPPLGGPGVRGLHRRLGPGLGGPGFPGPGFGLADDLAKALGISERELFTRLRAGKSIAAIAKAEGKSLADVRSAVKAAAKTRVDKAVAAGKLTRKQADAMLAHLDKHLTHLDRLPHKRLRFRAPGEKTAPPGERKQGRFVPEAPAPALPPGVSLR